MSESTNIDLLSERALYAVAFAEEEARLLGSGYVGMEHLLLGLLRDEDSAAGRVLRALDVTSEMARAEIERVEERPDPPGHPLLGLAPAAVSAIGYAQFEAESADLTYVGTHHLLLGLTHETPNIAMTVLGECGVLEPELRERVAATLEMPDLPTNDMAPVLQRPMMANRARALLRGTPPPSYRAAAPLSTSTDLPRTRPARPYATQSEVSGFAAGAFAAGQMRDHFDKFTEHARQALGFAQEEARRFNHNYIGTEHQLLGLLRVQDSMAARVLVSMGVDLDRARDAVEFIIGRGDRIVLGDIGLTPRAKKVVELAVDEARRLNPAPQYIGTEHLLLGIVREGDGIGAGVMASLGVSLEMVRRHTLRMLTAQSAELSVAPESQAAAAAALPEAAAPTEATQTPGASERERFDRFTERARKVLSLAQEEAQRLGHNYVGTEHLLLGLVKEGDGLAAKVLQNLGVTLRDVRMRVEETIGHVDRIVVGEIGMTSRVKRVLELATDEAWRLGHAYVGTEHLLLGTVREGEGVAARILQQLGVDVETVRSMSIRIISSAQHVHQSQPTSDALPQDAPPAPEPPAPEPPAPEPPAPGDATDQPGPTGAAGGPGEPPSPPKSPEPDEPETPHEPGDPQ